MKRALRWLHNLFFPPAGSPWWMRLAPYVVIVILLIGFFVSGTYAWDYTDSPEFCGMACHSRLPEYMAYQQSPHAQVKCVECHIDLEPGDTQFARKARIFRHVAARAFRTYEPPIEISSLRPTREVCEGCHAPEEFPGGYSQREFVHYASDIENTPAKTYLLLKTGETAEGLGLGPGVHWHVKNQVLFYAADDQAQEIPYVKISDATGIATEYVDISADFDPYTLDESQLQEMDCLTCHNRTSHTIYQPEAAVDQALFQEIISPEIPEIRRKAVEVLRASYDTSELAVQGIAELADFYRDSYPDFYDLHSEKIRQAIDILQDVYARGVFPEQKVDWDTYPSNLGHQNAPGCFRCHDGQHLNDIGRAIRLECNLCHTIPTVAGPNEVVTQSEISQDPQPSTHANPNWIALHRLAFDENDENEYCSSCHDIRNYRIADDSSFCANSACHGGILAHLDFTALDAPQVREIMLQQLPHYPRSLPPIAAWGDSPSLETFHQVRLGLGCRVCHDPFPPVEPPANDVCLKCHGGSLSGWQEMTADFEPNPHDGHYGDLSCSTCHKNFGPERSPCSLCHEDIPMVSAAKTPGD